MVCRQFSPLFQHENFVVLNGVSHCLYFVMKKILNLCEFFAVSLLASTPIFQMPMH